MIDSAKAYFIENNRKMLDDTLKKLILSTTENEDYKATISILALAGLLQFFYKEFLQACEFFIQLVFLRLYKD